MSACGKHAHQTAHTGFLARRGLGVFAAPSCGLAAVGFCCFVGEGFAVALAADFTVDFTAAFACSLACGLTGCLADDLA